MNKHNHDLIVISDLHLGEGQCDGHRYAPTEDFFHDAGFARFLKYIDEEYKKQNREVVLVLNGDIFDFLTITSVPNDTEASRRGFEVAPAEQWFGLNPSEAKSIYKLDIIFKGHRKFFYALSKFVKDGHRIEITRGNHDLELYFDGVQKQLLKHLSSFKNGATSQDTKNNIRFHHLFYLEEGRVHIEHGHQYDATNSIRYPLKPTWIKKHWWRKDIQEEETLDYPLGSIFVKFFYNRVRQLDPYAPRLLSPEQYMSFIRRYNLFDVWRIYKDHYPYFIAALSPSTVVGSSGSTEKNDFEQKKNFKQLEKESGKEDLFSRWNQLKNSPESASKVAVVRKTIEPIFKRALWTGLFAFSVLFLWLLVFYLIQDIPWVTANAFVMSLFTFATLGAVIWTYIHFVKKLKIWKGNRVNCDIEAAKNLAALTKVPIVVLGHSHKVEYKKLNNNQVLYANSGTWTSVANPWNKIMRDARRLTFVQIKSNDLLICRWNDDAMRFDEVPIFAIEEESRLEEFINSMIPNDVTFEPDQEHAWLPSVASENDNEENSDLL